LDYITADIWELIEYAELYKKGLPPVAGGALDQSAGFVAAARFIFGEQDKHKKKLGIP